jgi:hypothetical protein
LWSLLAQTATRPDDPEDEEPQRQTEKEKETGRGVFKLSAQAIIKRMARAAVVKIVTVKPHSKTSRRAVTIIAAHADDQAAAFSHDIPDSMNPYWEADAHLTEIDGGDYNDTPIPQENYRLAL